MDKYGVQFSDYLLYAVHSSSLAFLLLIIQDSWAEISEIYKFALRDSVSIPRPWEFNLIR